MLCRSVTVCALLFFPLLAGCSQGDTRDLSKTPWVAKTAKWPELEGLHNGPSGNLQRAFRMAGGVQMPAPNWFNEPQFVESLQKFEATPIPAEFASPEREATKTELVALVKKLQATGGSKPSKEVARQVRRVRYLYEKMIYIPGQIPPQGSEAAKYSTVIPPVEPIEPDLPVSGKSKSVSGA